MNCRFWFIANVAMLALWPADVTAGPVDAVMAFFGLTPRAEERGMLMPRPEEIFPDNTLVPKVNDRESNEETMEYNPMMNQFEEMISIEGVVVDISTETDEVDKVVCPQSAELAEALVELETKRKQVMEAWIEKEKLLATLGDVMLNVDHEEEFYVSVLDCDLEGDSAKSGCNLLGEMELASEAEGEILKASTIADYATNVEDYHYHCACTFSEWTVWSKCQGGTVAQLYDHCDADGSEEDCTPVEGHCEDGEKTRTRDLLWPEKNGGGVCDADLPADMPGQLTKDGARETNTDTCKAGAYGGKCPQNCEWTEWNPSTLEEAHCGTLSCGEENQETRTITRQITQQPKWGGRLCFGGETLSEKCTYEAAVAQSEAATNEEIKALKAKTEALVAAMCKGGKGPCVNGQCQVQYSDNEEVTKWCICDASWGGHWCDQSE